MQQVKICCFFSHITHICQEKPKQYSAQYCFCEVEFEALFKIGLNPC